MRNLKNDKVIKLLSGLFDDGNFMEINPCVNSDDDTASLICVHGKVNEKYVYAFAQNSEINGGAVCRNNVIKLKKLYSLALKTGAPIVGIYDSCGGNLNEGNELLIEYNTILCECNRLSGVVPQVSIILGMCFGISAVIASSADVLIMDKKAKCGLDIGGDNSDYVNCEKSGVSHITCENNEECIFKARKILSMLPSNNISSVFQLEYIEPNISENLNLSNPYSVIDNLVDGGSFVEFQKNFGRSFVTGLSTIKGNTVGIIISTDENSGTIDADSCVKISRFIRVCDSYSIPCITMINANKFNSLKEASRVCSVYSEATCVKITVIIGRACGAVNVAFCGQNSIDVVLSWETAVISALPPETAVEVLWHDRLKNTGYNTSGLRKTLENEYLKEQSSSFLACKSGLAQEIISESQTREKISYYLSMLVNKREFRLPKKHSNMRI